MNARQAVATMAKGHKVRAMKNGLVLHMDEHGDVKRHDGSCHVFGLRPDLSEFEIYTKEQEVKDAVYEAVGRALAKMDGLDCVVDVEIDVKVIR